MPTQIVGTPETHLFRIGRAPNPLAWAPWDRVGEGRFDDPRAELHRYRVLYAGERRACFLEALARFRPSPFDAPREVLSQRWLSARRIAQLRIADPDRIGRWLDLRSPRTFEMLKWELSSVLRTRDLDDFDLNVATSQELVVTQAVSDWAITEGCHGIVYVSRFDPTKSCWALFERSDMLPFHEVRIESIRPDDPDLLQIIDEFDLPPLLSKAR
jgi:hypothetical protein